MSDFPKYYRHNNMAIKQISPDVALEVEVPVGNELYPCSMRNLLYSPGMLIKLVNEMEEITGNDFLAYIGTFTAGARRISEVLNKHQQQVYDNARAAGEADKKEIRK